MTPITRFAAALALAVSCAAASAQPARYELDPDHAVFAFLVDHVGYAKVLGQFLSTRGSYVFDERTGALSELRIEADAASVFTNHRRRDDHLKGPDFLDVRRHPKLVFTAAGAKRTGDRTFEIEGELELLGRRQPLVLQATWNRSARTPVIPLIGPYVMGVSARGAFRRSAYGMSYGVDDGWVGDEVQLILEVEAHRR